jgi:hypothetical protein
MINKSVRIGSKERPVNFGRNFWAELEQITGKNITKLLQIDELMSIKNQTAIAFSSLKWGLYDSSKGLEPSPDFTIHQVADWLDERPEAIRDITDLLTSSIPSKKNVEAEANSAN